MSTRTLLPRAALAAAAAMIALSGWRWHDAQRWRPERLPDAGEARLVAVYQPGDCPEARAVLHALVAGARERGLDARTAAIPRRRGAWLARDLERDDEKATTRSLHRAILRSGLVATPAILIVDAGGIVRFAHPVGSGTPEPAIGPSVAALAGALDLLRLEADARARVGGPAPAQRQEGPR